MIASPHLTTAAIDALNLRLGPTLTGLTEAHRANLAWHRAKYGLEIDKSVARGNLERFFRRGPGVASPPRFVFCLPGASQTHRGVAPASASAVRQRNQSPGDRALARGALVTASSAASLCAQTRQVRPHLSGEGVRGQNRRPELMRLLDSARKGDVVIVWKLDRLARSLRRSSTPRCEAPLQ